MWPLVEIVIEPKSRADSEKLRVALRELTAGDQAFRVATERAGGRTILSGTSEAHLDLKIDALRCTYGVEAEVGAPQVAYRETLGRKTDIDYTHKKQTGGSGQFARVKITFEPAEPGAGNWFSSKILDRQLPRAYVLAVEKGLYYAGLEGLLASFPVIDFRATLTDGAYHDVDSSVLAFEIAARAAFRELRKKGAPKLLEPIMKVEVTTPEDWVGDVIGDLSSRRGQVQGQDQRGNAQVVIAMVPLANMFGYVNTLRSMTQGRANFHMEYDHYNAVPLPGPPDDMFPPAIGMRA